MKLLANFPHERPDAARYAAITLGVFDGVHRGHQAILVRLGEVAAGRPTCVVTFEPHPRAVLGPAKPHRMLSTIDERVELLAAFRPDAIAILRFDAAIARLDYRTFVREALVGALGAKDLVLGHDVRLGRDREGTPETLTALGHELGYRTHLLAPVAVGGEIVSSTRIRHLLDGGDVENGAAALGRPYALGGVVVRGKGRGRAIGVPTANLSIAKDKLIPAHGVYAARVVVPGESLHRAAAVNIGVAPTFEASAAPTVEAHLLDLDADLYGQTLRLQFLARLRAERRFDDAAALVAQIRADLDAVREVVAARRDG